MKIDDWNKSWNEKMKQLSEFGRGAKQKRSRGPYVIQDSFPADVVGKRDDQTGIILESRSQYRRELAKRGFTTVSPKEGNQE